MSTIEEKILNGPKVSYCEADDDDIRANESPDDDNSESCGRVGDATSLFVKPDDETASTRMNSRHGCSKNTGAKGVIEDYKQSMRANKKNSEFDQLEAEFQELFNDDSILQEHIMKRLAESKSLDQPIFGRVFRLTTGSELLDAIDKENSSVLVVVHIYTRFSRSCVNVDRCLDELADDLKNVKFLTLEASAAGLSENFKEKGVPALLAYKSGKLVKSLLQLDELLDKDFQSSQIKELLAESGLISCH